MVETWVDYDQLDSEIAIRSILPQVKWTDLKLVWLVRSYLVVLTMIVTISSQVQLPAQWPSLARELGLLFWMMCSVMARKPNLWTAVAFAVITVSTLKMQESSVWVWVTEVQWNFISYKVIIVWSIIITIVQIPSVVEIQCSYSFTKIRLQAAINPVFHKKSIIYLFQVNLII